MSPGEIRLYNDKLLVAAHYLPSPVMGLFCGPYGREAGGILVTVGEWEQVGVAEWLRCRWGEGVGYRSGMQCARALNIPIKWNGKRLACLPLTEQCSCGHSDMEYKGMPSAFRAMALTHLPSSWGV
jgi:hypothetical protein